MSDTNAKNSKNSQPQFLVCPYCDGSGLVEKKKCSNCQGVGIAAWTGQELIYWGKRIDALQLAQDKTKLFVNNLINFVLLVIAIIGLLHLGFVIYIFGQGNLGLWLIFKYRSLPMFIFWLSLITDGYLFYRISTETEKIKMSPKKRYEWDQKSINPISWLEIKGLKNKQKVDVSKFYDFEATTAVNKAWEFARKYRHAEINPVHLLIALLTTEQVNVVFSRLGVPFNSLKVRLSNFLAKQIYSEKNPAVSQIIYKILIDSYYSAWNLHQGRVDATDLLESLVTIDEETQELLYDVNVDLNKINNVISWIRIRKQLYHNWQRFRQKASLRPKGTLDKAMTAIATPALDTFSQDLTMLAKMGYLLPCIDREKEFEEILRIMHGGTRRSVILLGNPGVGRTTIIEGIAQRMVEEDVPDFLKDKRLVSLSVSKLVSGASPTEAQQRLLIILNEIRRAGNIILFVSDIHNMVGITMGRAGSIDLAGVLAKVLATNTVLCLATTTPGDYRRYIEGKSEFEDVLEVVKVEEISGDSAIQVLQAKAGAIEYQNQVYFSYDAIAKTVELSDRYLHDRYLPEKAIQVLQEVAVQVKDLKPKNSLVTANDVAKIVSEKTNIPLTEITKEESEKLLNLEEKIHERIIDQEEAVNMVATSLRRARAELRDISRPIVNLLFLGPTGVGKTELAKTVAAVYFGAEENMIRVDMSEYQEKSSINRLIGAPPGYGESQGGYLTENVRKNPFSLLLLDEIEKAHPDILNILLQVMDDGRLTDSTGRTVDFTNVILIATSNAATGTIQEYFNAGHNFEEIKKMVTTQELGKYFKPEFMNRFDGIIIFKPLTLNEVRQIATLMLRKVAFNLEEKGIYMKITPAGLDELAQQGFDPQFGARPLRRVIQQKVQDPLANMLISNKISRRDTVVLDAGNKILIEKAKII